MDALDRLLDALARASVRFVMIGASGANYYGQGGSTAIARTFTEQARLESSLRAV